MIGGNFIEISAPALMKLGFFIFTMQMKTQENKRNFRWQRVGLAIALGVVAMMLAGIAFDRWRVRNGWCARFFPNGEQKILYGDDCWK